MDQRRGIARRPTLPYATEVYAWIQGTLLTLPHNPPYHTDIELSMVPSTAPKPDWPDWPEVNLHKRENVSRLVRNHMARKKSFDLINHPGVI